jgi:hypothetical protein
MKLRTVMAAAFAALSLSACVAYDADNPALNDDPAVAARRAQDPFARDPFFDDPVYVLRYDRFGRPFYVPVAPTGPERYGYWGGGIGRGPSAGGYGGRGRHKEQHRIEDAQRGPGNGMQVDPNRNIREECQDENCGLKPIGDQQGDQKGDQPRDPVSDANQDLSARARCGNDPAQSGQGLEQTGLASSC